MCGASIITKIPNGKQHARWTCCYCGGYCYLSLSLSLSVKDFMYGCVFGHSGIFLFRSDCLATRDFIYRFRFFIVERHKPFIHIPFVKGKNSITEEKKIVIREQNTRCYEDLIFVPFSCSLYYFVV